MGIEKIEPLDTLNSGREKINLSFDEIIKRLNMLFGNYRGSILYGKIIFDRLKKEIIIDKKTTIVSDVGIFNLTDDTPLTIKYPVSNSALWLVHDYSNKTTFVSSDLSALKEKGIVIIAYIFNDQCWCSDDSRIITVPFAKFDNSVNVSFIDWNKQIEIDTAAKTIKIPSGQTPIDNRTGMYYSYNSNATIDYSGVTIGDGNALVSLFLRPKLNSTNAQSGKYDVAEYYADYTPRNPEDFKVFSIYGGKVYGLDEQSLKIISVNGVGNGGHGFKQGKQFNISDWYTKAASGVATKLYVLGDSTFQAYDGETNIQSFFERTQSKFDEYFGTGKISITNGAIGGQTILQQLDVFKTYLTSNTPDVVFIGAGLNGIEANNVTQRKQALETIIQLCLNKNIVPVICTPQSHQVPFSSKTWVNRTQESIERYDLPMRLSIAKKYNLDVLDFRGFTQKIIENAPEKIKVLLKDGLHGSSVMHDYESSYLFAKIVPSTISLDDSSIIPIYNQKVLSQVDLASVWDITKDKYGFKSQYSYTAKEDDLLMDFWVMLNPEKSTLWNMKVIVPTGSVKISVNGTSYTSNSSEFTFATNMKTGLYHIQVKAVAGTLKFNGLVFELN